MSSRQERIGEALLAQAKAVRDTYGQDISLSEVLELHAKHFIFDEEADKADSIGAHSREVYIAELRVRSEAGDKHAGAMLAHLEKGVELNEDPGGN